MGFLLTMELLYFRGSVIHSSMFTRQTKPTTDKNVLLVFFLPPCCKVTFAYWLNNDGSLIYF